MSIEKKIARAGGEARKEEGIEVGKRSDGKRSKEELEQRAAGEALLEGESDQSQEGKESELLNLKELLTKDHAWLIEGFGRYLNPAHYEFAHADAQGDRIRDPYERHDFMQAARAKYDAEEKGATEQTAALLEAQLSKLGEKVSPQSLVLALDDLVKDKYGRITGEVHDEAVAVLKEKHTSWGVPSENYGINPQSLLKLLARYYEHKAEGEEDQSKGVTTEQKLGKILADNGLPVDGGIERMLQLTSVYSDVYTQQIAPMKEYEHMDRELGRIGEKIDAIQGHTSEKAELDKVYDDLESKMVAFGFSHRFPRHEGRFSSGMPDLDAVHSSVGSRIQTEVLKDIDLPAKALPVEKAQVVGERIKALDVLLAHMPKDHPSVMALQNQRGVYDEFLKPLLETMSSSQLDDLQPSLPPGRAQEVVRQVRSKEQQTELHNEEREKLETTFLAVKKEEETRIDTAREPLRGAEEALRAEGRKHGELFRKAESLKASISDWQKAIDNSKDYMTGSFQGVPSITPSIFSSSMDLPQAKRMVATWKGELEAGEKHINSIIEPFKVAITKARSEFKKTKEGAEETIATREVPLLHHDYRQRSEKAISSLKKATGVYSDISPAAVKQLEDQMRILDDLVNEPSISAKHKRDALKDLEKESTTNKSLRDMLERYRKMAA